LKEEALSGRIVLEEVLDLSYDRLLMIDWLISHQNKFQNMRDL
jgi:hypothetical protein